MRNLRTLSGSLLLIAMVVAALVAIACGGGDANPTPTPTQTDTPSTPTVASTPTDDGSVSACPGAIPWDEAGQHIDEWATVKGSVVTTTYSKNSRGQPTFLNIGRPYPDPDRFTVVIWVENRSNFQPPPERAYDGKMVCVTGRIYLYSGVTQMEADDSSDIDTDQ